MNKKIISKSILVLFMCSAVFAQEAAADKIDDSDSQSYTEAEVEAAGKEEVEVDGVVIEIDKSTPDSYDDSEAYEEYAAGEAAPKKKKEGFFKDLFTFGNKGEYIYTDEASCFYKTFGGGIKQYAATITVDPDNGEAGFGSKYQAGYYIIMMDKKSRANLKKAVQQYFDDFENKKLIRNKSNKTVKSYGKTKIHMHWGTLKTTTPNNGSGDATFGYEFIENSPYFVMTIPEIENLHYKDTTAVARGSNRMQFCFTKSQISTILDMITEEKVSQAINDYNIKEYGVKQDADNY